MKTLKSILATVAILGLSVNAFAMGDDAGTLGSYLSGSDQISSSLVTPTAASADYFLTPNPDAEQ